MLFALQALLGGGSGEDASFFLTANLVSWLGATGIDGLIELVRLIDSELQSKPTPAQIEGSVVPGREGADVQDMQQRQAAEQIEGITMPRRYVAEFTSNSSASARITVHRAVIDCERENLMLSVYEGGPDRPCELVQTCVARNWDELSLYLQSKTHFRRSDFHAGS